MIREEICTLVPNAQAVDIISLKDYQINHNYNVVISTIVIEDEKNLIIVHPILTDNDRISILKKCMKYEDKNHMNVSQIAEIAKKYMTEKNLQAFKKELMDHFSNVALESYIKKNNYGRGICQELEDSHIRIVQEHMDWEKAIQVSSENLLNEGYIKQSYIDSMIRKTKQYGPYMFITENVVLAHSEIEDGANLLGISLTIFKDPVIFITQENQKRKAQIILVLSAEDQTAHIKILNDIMTIFKDERNAEKIWKCRNTKEVQKVICRIVQEES